jgi:hypothetical protein
MAMHPLAVEIAEQLRKASAQDDGGRGDAIDEALGKLMDAFEAKDKVTAREVGKQLVDIFKSEPAEKLDS